MKQYTKLRKSEVLLITIRLPRRRLSSQSFGKYWQLNKNNQETEHIQMQTNRTQKVAQINSRKYSQKPTLRERTDRARFSRLLRQPASKQSFLYSQNWKQKLIKMCKYPNQHCWTMVHTFWCCWWRRRFWWWWTGWFTSRLRQTSHHHQHCRTCLMKAHTPQNCAISMFVQKFHKL